MVFSSNKAISLASLLAGLMLVQAVIWFPEVMHFRVPDNIPSQKVLDQSAGDRNVGLAGAIQEIDFALTGEMSDVETVLAADSMLGGTLSFPRNAPREIEWPFEKHHLLLGHSGFQLKMAGLAWVEIALDAWRLTGEAKYLDFAVENALRFAQFEQRRFLPMAYLWNDHAVANRAVVYAQLWFALQSRGPVDRETAGILLRAADRTAQMVAKPTHYTFRTNHGLMQNIALIVIAAAFPSLEDAESYKRTGYERLARQMHYYISSQGAVLEHSAGYHEFGVGLLRSCFALLEGLSISVPEAWQVKLQRSEEWLRVLSRPDLSVPNFGNSEPRLGDVGREVVVELATENSPDDADDADGSYLMDAGYGVFRSGIGAATNVGVHATIAWSHFISGAHKHADELGVHYWSNGTSWWTSVGYWPYQDPRLKRAINWAGSNAPHFVGEEMKSERSSRLISFGDGGDYSIWALERQNDDGFSVVRQAVFFRDEWALIIDSFEDPMSRATEVVWGVSPEVAIVDRGERTARLVDRASGQALGVGFDATVQFDLNYLNGSSEPFGGWMVYDGAVEEAGAIRILSRGPGALVTGWGKLSEDQVSAVDVSIRDWQQADQWSVDLVVAGQYVNVQRVESTFTLANDLSMSTAIEATPADVDQSLSAEIDAYMDEAAMAEIYPEYFPWRLRASNYLLYLFLGLAALLLFVPERRVAGLVPVILTVSLGGSLAFSAFLHFVYFAP